VRRVSYNRDEIDLIRQRIANGHQMQITLFDSLRELRKEIEALKATKPTEGNLIPLAVVQKSQSLKTALRCFGYCLCGCRPR
jgi:hypothetical protein